MREIVDDKLVDMLIISETKIDSSFNDNLFQVEGYKTERLDTTALGGGLMTFVRSDLPFKRRKDLECEELETICYELAMSNTKWGIIDYYRQPFMTNQTFESDMTKCLETMFMHYENLIYIGAVLSLGGNVSFFCISFAIFRMGMIRDGKAAFMIFGGRASTPVAFFASKFSCRCQGLLWLSNYTSKHS